jgi:hypothetical protein
MYSRQIAAAVAGLCLMWGTAQAGNDGAAQERNGAAAVAPPEAVGATSDVVILELGPTHRGGASAEESAAMQMLLLQFLLMQSEGVGNPEMIDVPRAPVEISI